MLCPWIPLGASPTDACYGLALPCSLFMRPRFFISGYSSASVVNRRTKKSVFVLCSFAGFDLGLGTAGIDVVVSVCLSVTMCYFPKWLVFTVACRRRTAKDFRRFTSMWNYHNRTTCIHHRLELDVHSGSGCERSLATRSINLCVCVCVWNSRQQAGGPPWNEQLYTVGRKNTGQSASSGSQYLWASVAFPALKKWGRAILGPTKCGGKDSRCM